MFLGIVSMTLEKIQDWLTIQHKNATFLTNTMHYLREFKKVTIDWLPVLSFTRGKLGAWVSENYLAFSRIMLWYFQNIGTAEQKNDNAPPEGLPQNKWLVKHNRYWLKLRELNTEGKAAELSVRVANYMKEKPIPPEVPQPERLAEHIEHTLIALQYVLECVMTSKVSDEVISKCNYAIQIFLSKFDKMESTIRAKDAKPTVVSAFNFACLINLVDAMETYGPLRNLWEGGPRGEGFLRIMKPAILQGLQTNFHYNLLKNMLTAKAFDNILVSKDDNYKLKDKNSLILAKQKRQFHKYSSIMEVFVKITEKNHLNKTPLSVVLLEDDCGVNSNTNIFIVVQDYKSVVKIGIEERTAGKKKFGLQYYKYYLAGVDNNVLDWENEVIALSTNPRLGFAILLPLMEEEATEENCLFAMISMNWKSLTDISQLKSLID
jgi:hypothetical protein